MVILKPAKSGSTFLNYKQTFSLVLMAIEDANYKFLYVNVGAQGRISDAGVFNNCNFFTALQSDVLGLPKPCELPNSSVVAPYMLVADDAFPLSKNIMKPFPKRNLSECQRIFNHRLSRARRVVENASGIMSAKFRVYKSPMALKNSSVKSVVLATACLHNFLRDRQIQSGTDSDDHVVVGEDTADELDEDEGKNSGGLLPMKSVAGRVSADAKALRQTLAIYFANEGAVTWQWKSTGLRCD